MIRFLGFPLFLLGCMEPVDKQPTGEGSSGSSSSQPNIQVTNPDGTTNNQAQGNQNTPLTKGTHPPNEASEAQFTQEELADGGVINGLIQCEDCGHQILIRALPAPPKNGEAGAGGKDVNVNLITQLILSEPGTFSIRVPDNISVVLQATDDANDDGKATQNERFGMRSPPEIEVSGEVFDIKITIGEFPEGESDELIVPSPEDIPTPDGSGGEVPNPGDMPTPDGGSPGAIPNPGDMPTPDGGSPGVVPNPGDMPTPEGGVPGDAPPSE